MHWADVIANELTEKCDHPFIAAGISPTGVIHVGSLREAITSESVYSALKGKGSDARFVYLIDSIDPLRRRYDFLPEEFEKYVGKPICYIPCPCGKHDNYAHHFVQPFLDAIKSLNVECEVIWTHELYEKGAFAETIDMSIKKRDLVARILSEVSGRDVGEGYSPYEPICEKCGVFAKPDYTNYEFPYVEYTCTCGHHGKADVRKGEGKLKWRVEWPAKWKIFGTAMEPFGKDHAAAGGSYDTGKRIVTEVFEGVTPYPVRYEFVQLKGIGQMHKSTGSMVTGNDAIGITPPEVLNYQFLRVNPEKAIDYDFKEGILDMVDEYDRMERLFFTKEFTDVEENSVRAYEIAQHNNLPAKMPMQIPYRHLVNVAQMASDFDGVMEILRRTEDMDKATPEDIERIRRRVDCVRYWLNGFAPDNFKFSVSEKMPDVKVSDEERAYYAKLADKLESIDWNSVDIGNAVVEEAKAVGLSSKKGFGAVYRIFIQRESGPRLGLFLAAMERSFVIGRIREAA